MHTRDAQREVARLVALRASMFWSWDGDGLHTMQLLTARFRKWWELAYRAWSRLRGLNGRFICCGLRSGAQAHRAIIAAR